MCVQIGYGFAVIGLSCGFLYGWLLGTLTFVLGANIGAVFCFMVNIDTNLLEHGHLLYSCNAFACTCTRGWSFKAICTTVTRTHTCIHNSRTSKSTESKTSCIYMLTHKKTQVVRYLLRARVHRWLNRTRKMKALMRAIDANCLKFAFISRFTPIPWGLQNCLYAVCMICLWGLNVSVCKCPVLACLRVLMCAIDDNCLRAYRIASMR